MIESQRTPSPALIDSKFESLYESLAIRWESHQLMKQIPHTPIVELANSAQQLSQARDAMWTWWSQNKKG